MDNEIIIESELEADTKEKLAQGERIREVLKLSLIHIYT